MRIANWNLARLTRLTSARGQRVNEWLRRVGADVWVLTETHASIAPRDGWSCVATIGSDRAAEDGEQWVAVWSPWEMERLDVVDDATRCVAARVLHPDGSFVVYGTVLPWIGSSWRGVRSGEAFLRALDLQASEWRRFCDLGEPVIVAGDFNQDLLDQGHYYGSRAGRVALREALGAAGLVAVTAGGDDSPHATIDHVCVSPEWRVAGVARWPDTIAPDKRLSDHFGVWVDVAR